MDIHLLAGTRLFHGIREHEIEAMLTCLSAEERTYGKEAYICDRPSGGGDGRGGEHH